jgi:transposase-like protein
LTSRGLGEAKLVLSDAHECLKAAVAALLTGGGLAALPSSLSSQRAVQVRKANSSMVAAAIRTVFAQPHQEATRQQLAEVIALIRPRWGKAAEALATGEAEVETDMSFPVEQRTPIYSTNPPRATEPGDQATHPCGQHLS